jgi:hypothetical protein
MSNPERSSRRRKQAVAGVVGLAAVLGGGAFVVTDQLTGDEPATVSAEAGAPAPVDPPATASAPASAPAAPSAAPSRAPAAATAPPAPAPATTTARPRTTQEIIAAVKGAAARATGNVKRPPAPAGTAVTDAEVTVAQSGSLRDAGGTLRVVSARRDLTGQRELSWVAGQKGEKVGDARCTQSIRVSPDVPLRERPTLLVCWRTSAAKSVYTIAVNLKQRPSKQASVAALTKVWNQL